MIIIEVTNFSDHSINEAVIFGSNKTQGIEYFCHYPGVLYNELFESQYQEMNPRSIIKKMSVSGRDKSTADVLHMTRFGFKMGKYSFFSVKEHHQRRSDFVEFNFPGIPAMANDIKISSFPPGATFIIRIEEEVS